MIRLVFAAFLSIALAGIAHADTRSVYTIRDIPVDERAGSVIEARQNALASARLVGARRMIEKITLAEDRAAAGGISIDYPLAQRFAVAVDVQEETRGGDRYRGVLSAVYNPREVRAWLAESGIPYIDTQAPRALLIPVAAEADAYAWASALAGENTYAMAPTVTSRRGGYNAGATWIDLEEEAVQLDARRGILAELVGAPGNHGVRLTLVTQAGNQPIGTTGRVATLAEAVAALHGMLDRVWKQNSIVRGDQRRMVEASVLYTSIAEWNTLRGALARSPLVSQFQTRALARDGALVQFTYAGDEAQLAQDLRQRGLAIDTDPAGWILTSAITPVR